ncbi:MAG: PIG-L family deacetylase [Acidobacteria bacterium]|nr:PIG-L family deacetylase [Acidobacteriota bacterium]
MNRRALLSLFPIAKAWAQQASQPFDAHGPLVIERKREGKPRAGQTVLAIQPHSDDIPIFAAGLFAKLIDEGATPYLIRVTNDDMAGPGNYAETVMANRRDHDALGKVFGVKKIFDLNYNNHMMDNIARSELRQRFIFLFRLLKADIVITYDPTGHYEENPDHYVTSACVEAAAWMAAGDKDYPEHFDAGLTPYAVKEKYYFARFQQQVNRVIDITPWIEKKIDANLENKAQGPAGETGAKLRAKLAAEGRALPLLGDNDLTANREYIRQFVLARDRQTGAKYGLQYAEPYHYIGPGSDAVGDYIKRNARRPL